MWASFAFRFLLLRSVSFHTATCRHLPSTPYFPLLPFLDLSALIYLPTFVFDAFVVLLSA